MTRAQHRARLRELRKELRYCQAMNRLDASILRGGIARAKRIGALMRALQRAPERKRS
ncbi:MAG TPA: hypothetical protein VI793_17215 [Anaerolineales bacterium]|nr:hypothetical protein [Anaerolineales bacterium]